MLYLKKVHQVIISITNENSYKKTFNKMAHIVYKSDEKKIITNIKQCFK